MSPIQAQRFNFGKKNLKILCFINNLLNIEFYSYLGMNKFLVER